MSQYQLPNYPITQITQLPNYEILLMSRIVLVLTTVPSDALGEELATALVSERLAACVNIGAAMTSIYRWKGSVERETERQLVIKTTVGSGDSRSAAHQRTALVRAAGVRGHRGLWRQRRISEMDLAESQSSNRASCKMWPSARLEPGTRSACDKISAACRTSSTSSSTAIATCSTS